MESRVTEKNSAGYELSPLDEWVIGAMLSKLEEIRNYQSHVWHDNVVLAFDEPLVEFIEKNIRKPKLHCMLTIQMSCLTMSVWSDCRKWISLNFLNES